MKEETRVWLGLRPGDVLLYLAVVPIVALYFVDSRPAKAALAAVAVALLLAACPLGMRSSPNVSKFTNAYKKVAYPACVLLGLFFIGFSYVGYYQIPQNGMYPGLPAGSRFLTVRKPYRSADQVPRGDIVVFSNTVVGVRYLFIWRVVGLPGDTVETAGDKVIVNGQALPREELRREGDMVIFEETNGAVYEVAYGANPPDKPVPDAKVTVPDGHFFVMGDNRHNARDSRYSGPIAFESIVAKKW